MSTTIEIEPQPDHHRDIRVVSSPPTAIPVPDHVPAALAAEHPDAAAVVARQADPRRGLRIVDRGEQRASTQWLLALAACMTLGATFGGGAAVSPDSAVPSQRAARSVQHVSSPVPAPASTAACLLTAPWSLTTCAPHAAGTSPSRGG